MARPREFDETTVLEAAMNCFWAQGFEQTSVRDLAEWMGITGASLYNAFGDKTVALPPGFCPLPRADGAGPRCAAGEAAAGFGDPDIF